MRGEVEDVLYEGASLPEVQLKVKGALHQYPYNLFYVQPVHIITPALPADQRLTPFLFPEIYASEGFHPKVAKLLTTERTSPKTFLPNTITVVVIAIHGRYTT